jgi:Cu2+-exporting ATPase
MARPAARDSITELGRMGLGSRLVSGDRQGPVDAVAAAVGIASASGSLTPAEKLAAVSDGTTMMVGDGINDAPALRAAYVSMAPTTAADIGRSAADFVYAPDDLGAVPFVIATARRAARLVTQNLVLAIGYNAIAVPLAVCGVVTPLIAAVAMSSSSIIVVANALRLRIGTRPRPERRPMQVREVHA